MKSIERIKSLIKKSKSKQVDTTIIFEKQCPHCTSRGMFVFNDTSKIKTKIGESNEKPK
jgi:hypothetical protein